MRLLLDQNLSPRLVGRLATIYPGICHVSELGLASASDEEIWVAARQSGGLIVTKDSDFIDIQVLRGFPPKVLWLRLGNCSTSRIGTVLLAHVQDIQAFDEAPGAGLLTLG